MEILTLNRLFADGGSHDFFQYIAEKKAVTFFLPAKLELHCRLLPAERCLPFAESEGQFIWR